GTAATRVLFVMDGKVYSIDQDGADQKLVSSSDHQAMSPAWAADGRRFSYMEFWQGHGRLFLQEVASGKRAPVATTGQALDFTPAFSPDGKTLAFSRATVRRGRTPATCHPRRGGRRPSGRRATTPARWTNRWHRSRTARRAAGPSHPPPSRRSAAARLASTRTRSAGRRDCRSVTSCRKSGLRSSAVSNSRP